jgi:hypothetical protein
MRVGRGSPAYLVIAPFVPPRHDGSREALVNEHQPPAAAERIAPQAPPSRPVRRARRWRILNPRPIRLRRSVSSDQPVALGDGR